MPRKRRAPDEGRLARGRARAEARFPVPPSRAALPEDYAAAFAAIRSRIQQERVRAVLAANAAMVLLYWDIGRTILERQDRAGWGAKVIDLLSADLREAFPDMKGFSPRNLKYMRAFGAAWPDRAIVQELLARLPWYHQIALLEKLEDAADRLWYARQAIEQGWSHNILVLQIDSSACERQGKALTNFAATLPPGDSDLAAQVFKAPTRGASARSSRPSSTTSSASCSNSAPATDDLLRHPDDQPTIGLLLCREHDRLVVEYALRDLKKPIGVAGWETKLVDKLPKALAGSLPTVEEIEAELSGKRRCAPRTRRAKP